MRTLFVWITDIAVALFLCLFVYINVSYFRQTGEISYALIAFNETLWVLLYLVRTRAVNTSPFVFDWSIAFAGTFFSTLLRPAGALLPTLGTALVVGGTLLTISATIFLNRSIALVAAEREIKTGGIYRIIRHPMYASEMLVIAGYVLVNFSLLNVGVVAVAGTLLLVRADREEKLLSNNETYRQYCARTQWRCIPFIY